MTEIEMKTKRGAQSALKPKTDAERQAEEEASRFPEAARIKAAIRDQHERARAPRADPKGYRAHGQILESLAAPARSPTMNPPLKLPAFDEIEPARLLAVDDLIAVVSDKFPISPGHTLIIAVHPRSLCLTRHCSTNCQSKELRDYG